MLVLSRKNDETIVIPECGITIKVVGFSGGKVALGIDAPDDVDVWRGELLEEGIRRCGTTGTTSGTGQRRR